VRRHTLAKRPSEVEFLYEIINQDGEVAMTQQSLLKLKQRPEPSGN